MKNNYSKLIISECDVHDNFPKNKNEKTRIEKGVLAVEYRRDKVKIYKYNNTDLVNILVADVRARFKGKFDDFVTFFVKH